MAGRHANNFDLLRLLAATQVMIGHACSHLGADLPLGLLSYFPTLPIYLFMFLVGVILQRSGDFVRRYVAGRVFTWLAVFAAVEVATGLAGLRITGNFMNQLSQLALGLLVIAAAHARAIRLPGDVSYGVYLYHMPVVNTLLELGASGRAAALQAMGATFALAIASWLLIERPALSLKAHFAAFGNRALTASTRSRIASS